MSLKKIPFVATYHPVLSCLSLIIKDDLNILYMGWKAQKLFSPGPLQSFESASKMSSYLVYTP